MKIVLSDFKMWRIKKIICFTICIIAAFILGFCTKNMEKIGVFLLTSLVVYGCMIEQPFMKKNYIAYIENRGKNILVIINGKAVKIEKNEIQKVYMKEIRYGGKWLEPIGQRLIVCTDHKKYHFDSAFRKENDNNSTDIYKLYEMMKEEEMP